jgi:hypothetical protein
MEATRLLFKVVAQTYIPELVCATNAIEEIAFERSAVVVVFNLTNLVDRQNDGMLQDMIVLNQFVGYKVYLTINPQFRVILDLLLKGTFSKIETNDKDKIIACSKQNYLGLTYWEKNIIYNILNPSRKLLSTLEARLGIAYELTEISEKLTINELQFNRTKYAV